MYHFPLTVVLFLAILFQIRSEVAVAKAATSVKDYSDILGWNNYTVGSAVQVEQKSVFGTLVSVLQSSTAQLDAKLGKLQASLNASQSSNITLIRKLDEVEASLNASLTSISNQVVSVLNYASWIPTGCIILLLLNVFCWMVYCLTRYMECKCRNPPKRGSPTASEQELLRTNSIV